MNEPLSLRVLVLLFIGLMGTKLAHHHPEEAQPALFGITLVTLIHLLMDDGGDS
ncbi:hypothetical protein [Streptomyces sp. NPDC017991]|uniref:hypothetical protein n=1 Tax=Streptomyces sp. NPDC017991 TaxID=3365026 RepID=UPI00379EE23C